ncbi:unnamed protein product [Phytomonas sp. Hart1]|nr:unnamed protein product [Phytomonas sp. Hart1]|eukprot:CCW66923.1 unnamed protein product [Phytomonas sp. isolate Hart1]
MALAVWTCDSVLVYTTDSCVRHSDFTDLHARNITDVCWGTNARFLFTASLDGYVSVIRFGSSLTLAHHLPIFSNHPLTISLTKVLRRRQQKLESEQRGRKVGGSGEHGHDCDQGNTVIASVRKKKKTEAVNLLPTSLLNTTITDITTN